MDEQKTAYKPVIALVCGIVSVAALIVPGVPSLIGLAAGLAGIIIACIERKDPRPKTKQESNMLIWGLVLSIIGLALCALALIACLSCVACMGVSSFGLDSFGYGLGSGLDQMLGA